MNELEPCPFCGGSTDVWEHKYPNGDTNYEPLAWHDSGCILEHVLWCNDFETPEELSEAWNRRINDHE